MQHAASRQGNASSACVGFNCTAKHQLAGNLTWPPALSSLQAAAAAATRGAGTAASAAVYMALTSGGAFAGHFADALAAGGASSAVCAAVHEAQVRGGWTLQAGLQSLWACVCLARPLQPLPAICMPCSRRLPHAPTPCHPQPGGYRMPPSQAAPTTTNTPPPVPLCCRLRRQPRRAQQLSMRRHAACWPCAAERSWGWSDEFSSEAACTRVIPPGTPAFPHFSNVTLCQVTKHDSECMSAAMRVRMCM